jgi:hypothetical protein
MVPLLFQPLAQARLRVRGKRLMTIRVGVPWALNVTVRGQAVTNDKPHRACIDVIAFNFERCF